MRSFIVRVILASVCYLFVTVQAAAVEAVVAELQKDNSQDPASESQLSTNEECIQPKETGRCFALFYRFAYDVEKRKCVEFIYGGCAGNSNNFETKEDCEQKCLKNKENDLDDGDVLTTTVTSNTESEAATEQIVSS